MCKINVKNEDGKLTVDIVGTGKEIIALFAVIYEDLRQKFKAAGMVKAFDELVDCIIAVNKGD